MRSACAIHVRSSATRPSRVRAVVVAWIAGSPPTMSRSAPEARSIFAFCWYARRAASGSPLADELEPHDGVPVGRTCPHDRPTAGQPVARYHAEPPDVHVVGQSCVGSDRIVPRVAAGYRAEGADDREDGFARTRRRGHEEDPQLLRLGVPRDHREVSDRPHRHELLDVIENPDERLGQELAILRAALPRESDGELEHDDGRPALSGPYLEAADPALAHTPQQREPVLGAA